MGWLDNNGDKKEFMERFDKLALKPKDNNTKIEYLKLNDDILEKIKLLTKIPNQTTLIEKRAKLQLSINKLEKEKDNLKVDVESAIARDDVLRSRETNITPHALFILDRPIRKSLIPYLWVIAIVFIGIALVIFKMAMPTIVLDVNSSVIAMIINVVTSRTVLGSLLGAALIVIIFLSLKIGGVFGK